MASKTKNCHICVICSKTFKEKHQLTNNFAIHLNERPYKCETCGSSFKRSAHLLQHVLKHTEERPYRCVTCGFRCKRPAHLRSHVLRHGGEKEKPYKCTICKKKFFEKPELKRHRQIHSIHPSIKTHICVFCDRGFLYPNGLDNHIRSHIREKPYSYDVCSQDFTSSNILATHRRSASHQRKLNAGGRVSHDANNASASGRHASTKKKKPVTSPPNNLDTVIAEKEERMQVLNQEIQARKAKVRRLNGEISSREDEFKSLENELERLETAKAKGTNRFLNR
ncbi:unnamed protein product [Orchesella dallaii]|uniref:C2H2-type domain-containing protein n=1 Tax=Orchesella dallaii TaxID=48710 RepID=A0ABP1RP82_9HEXA